MRAKAAQEDNSNKKRGVKVSPAIAKSVLGVRPAPYTRLCQPLLSPIQHSSLPLYVHVT